MEEKNKVREYRNDDFKINCIYKEDGKPLNKIIEEAFKSYYDLKINA